MKNLAELIDKSWDIEYKHYLDAQICDERNENFLDATTSSSFQRFLVQQAWLPPDGNHASVSKPLYSGRELFDSTQQIRCLLHTHVPYIGAHLKSEDFVKCLHIKRSVNVSDLIKYLMRWSQESSENNLPFYTSIGHMTHVYLYLKQHEVEQSSVESQTIIEAFQEEKLIFVPDKYQDNSSADSVAGHFQSIHSVCWKDPSTVLYMRQKLSLSMPANLPKVLSLYYCIREDQNQLQQAFVHFGAPEAPRIASYITLLKYISTISPHPEAEHVNDFTSVAFELVRLCNDSEHISPEFIYNNLKNATVFPTKSRIWVSLEDCLLEDDDKNVAKCFQKSDNVSFILWPDVVNTKKHRNANRQQLLANQEAKEEFVKICRISKLSAKASPRVDFDGDARPVDSTKAQLSRWVVLIQQFIAANCEDFYIQLKEDGIQDKLCRLQVLSVMSLKCRYFIDHNGSQIASTGSIEKGCEYCYDDDTSAIYIAADKVEKPGALLSAMMKLFAQNATEGDANTIERFIQTLLLECPTSKDELEDLRVESNLQCLPDGEAVWEIPLPTHHLHNKSENSTDEESDRSTSEDEVDSTHGEESNDREILEGKMLTSWPPNVAVDPSATASRRIQQFPDSGKSKAYSQDMSGSMIGEEELHEARRKYLHGYVDSDASVTASQEVQADHHAQLPEGAISESKSKLLETTCDSSLLSPGSQSNNDSSRPLSEQRHGYIQSSADSLREQKQGPVERESRYPSDIQDHDHFESKKRTSSYQNYPEDSKWTAVKRARVDSEVNLIDIQHFVQGVQGSDTTPLVKLLEDSSAESEESLLKIGRWGEEYVYIILKKMKQLPDGSTIQSIQWINEDGETDKPYDIFVEVKSENPSQPRCVYIEVKSTAASEKELVSMSMNQLKFAEDHGENFHLYRVYSAGRPQSRLCMLENLHNYIKCHHIRFFFEL